MGRQGKGKFNICVPQTALGCLFAHMYVYLNVCLYTYMEVVDLDCGSRRCFSSYVRPRGIWSWIFLVPTRFPSINIRVCMCACKISILCLHTRSHPCKKMNEKEIDVERETRQEAGRESTVKREREREWHYSYLLLIFFVFLFFRSKLPPFVLELFLLFSFLLCSSVWES